MNTMIPDAQPVTVQILDKEYLIACPREEQESLLDSARFLDSKMKDIRSSGKVVGIDRIAVMAALNIAHDLLQSNANHQNQDESIANRIRAMHELIENALFDGKQLEN